MKRMKTFFMYLLIFLAIYVIGNWIISIYLKTSYYKINSYDIDVQKATVTIISAKASKDDGHIEGKISNDTNENINNKYMKVELFSNNDVNLGTEYVKIEELKTHDLKNFKIDFTCDNVKSFKITLIDAEEKDKEDYKLKHKSNIFNFAVNKKVEQITDELERSKDM